MILSIISPVYKSEKIVSELIVQIKSSLLEITEDYEIILVEDGSPDNSWKMIQIECKKEHRVKGIKLSRNFGQHYAVTAGLSKASGDFIVFMDCDLQDDPIYIKLLMNEAVNGYDIVYTKRKKRKHGFIKSFNSWAYNKLFEFFSEKKYDVDAGSLILFTKKVREQFLRIQDKDRLYLQLFKWMGFNTTTIEVEHRMRFEGKSSYSFLKLLKLGIQGWTSHSDKLLKFSTYVGFFLSFIAFLTGVSIVIRYFFYDLQPGWPSIIVTILFSTGLILMSIGVAGIYIGKIFEQSKNRPLFIIDQELNFNNG